MNPEVELHLGKYRRYLWEEKNLLVVIGDFEEVTVSKRLYEERHGISPVPGAEGQYLTELMGACALAAVSLSERESWGWTLTTAGSPHGYFCAVEPEGMVCGTRRDAPTDRNTVYLQRRKSNGPLVESRYEPEARPPSVVVEGYFLKVEQVQTVLRVAENGSGVLVQALPGGDMGAIRQIENDSLSDTLRRKAKEGEFKPMEEVLIFYECRCDDEMILNMLTSLPDDQRSGIWGDLPEITVECPRCTRNYTIQRQRS